MAAAWCGTFQWFLVLLPVAVARPRASASRAFCWSNWSSSSVPEDGPRGLSGQSNPVVLLLGLLSYVTVGAAGHSRRACTVLQSFPIPRVLVDLSTPNFWHVCFGRISIALCA